MGSAATNTADPSTIHPSTIQRIAETFTSRFIRENCTGVHSAEGRAPQLVSSIEFPDVICVVAMFRQCRELARWVYTSAVFDVRRTFVIKEIGREKVSRIIVRNVRGTSVDARIEDSAFSRDGSG